MPSNYTIAKMLQRIAYYREICGNPPGQFPGAMMEVQSLAGVRLDELYKTDWPSAQRYVNEADQEVMQAIEQIIRGETPAALAEDKVPLSILELTDIKGIGAKTAKRAYDELGVKNLKDLQAAVENGRLAKVKGFGPKMIEKIQQHLAASSATKSGAKSKRR